MTKAATGPHLLDKDMSSSGSQLDHSGTDTVLSVHDIVVSYGGVQAVQGVSFEVGRGERLGIIGPNGAGKSTLLGAIAGQIKAKSGSVSIGATDVSHAPAHVRARLGIARTFQTTSEFAGMTVFENLVTAGRGAAGASLWRTVAHPRSGAREEARVAARAWDVLDRFEMADHADSYGRELSGGQRRLVEIMRCLMCDPQVLLLDEPMVGVAPHLVDKMVADLMTIASDGIALVIVEHALEVIKKISDQVMVMALGQVIAKGSYDEVVADEAVKDAYLG